MFKPLAKIATVGAAITALTILGAPGAFAGPTGPVIVPGQLAVPSAATAYSVTPAHCVNGQSVEGVVTVNPLAHAQSRLGGELATTYTGYGLVNLEFIADAGYSFPDGPLVTILPSPDLGSVQNCTLPDTDKDGVADSVDQCPATPAGAAVDANGCADSQKDSDGDHVADSIDLCPGTPMGTQVDANGCALPTVKYVTPVPPTTTDHEVIIPESTDKNEGVVYTNGDGVVLAAGKYNVFQKAGPYHVDANGNLTVLAKPLNDNYVLTGLAHYMWPFHFELPVPVDTINSLLVTICHNDHAITVSANAIVHDHVGPNGAQETAHASHPEDTIPAFPYIEGGVAKAFPGLNDDAAGENLLMHNCVKDQVVTNPAPENPAPGTPEVPKTPDTQVPPVDTSKPEAPVQGGDKAPVSVSNPETPQAPAALANVGSSNQASVTSASKSVAAGTVADAETATDGGFANWLAIGAGLSLIVAAFHKKGLRRS